MPHPRGKRSEQAKRKRVLRRIIDRFCRYQREEAELVTIKSFDYLAKARQKKYPWREVTFIEFTELGEVLVDSRGKGSFQK